MERLVVVSRIKGKIKALQDERKAIKDNVASIMELVDAENAADEASKTDKTPETLGVPEIGSKKLSLIPTPEEFINERDEYYALFRQMNKDIIGIEKDTQKEIDEVKEDYKKKDEERDKETLNRMERRADLVTKFASDIGITIENALLAEKNQLKEFSKGLLLAGLAMLKKIADMAIAEATIKSIARYGLVKGAIRAGALVVAIEAAYGIARASVMKANKGLIVPGQGNTDTVPAILTPGEAVINKRSMTSSDTMTVSGTPYDIASQINSYKGYGIPFAAGGVAGSVTNNTYNYSTMEKMQSDISKIKVVLNVNEVTEAMNEINVINQTSEI